MLTDYCKFASCREDVSPEFAMEPIAPLNPKGFDKRVSDQIWLHRCGDATRSTNFAARMVI